ncbi:hypothetical protein J1614_010122 [Plenodomus biglobosus]|nr:hypothetical protein J1614_010122 [Plenodomus biglobosus]
MDLAHRNFLHLTLPRSEMLTAVPSKLPILPAATATKVPTLNYEGDMTRRVAGSGDLPGARSCNETHREDVLEQGNWSRLRRIKQDQDVTLSPNVF